ncbi:MAG: EAL domain-containing protein [Acidobacteria bacterium]|nr:EAL domain-containing protein [Acidobacteriota bacterium]
MDWPIVAIAAGCTVAWFFSFPLTPLLDRVDVGLDALLLATSVVALGYIREFRYRPLEIAWTLHVIGRLICLLDCFTVESSRTSVVIAATAYCSQAIGILAIVWAFRRYQQQRRRQISRLRSIKRRRVQSDRRFAGLVNAVEGIVWEADPQTFRFQFVSRQAERLLGYPVRQWYEEDGFWMNHIHPDDRDRAVGYCVVESKQHRPHQLEYRMVAADNRVVWLRHLVNSVKQQDGSWRLCGVMFVITQTKELEERLRHSATHDALTGLPNRDSLLARLREVHQRDAGAPRYALFFLDVDHFKSINDTMGHYHGDRVLSELARRLNLLVGSNGMVARLGGDEFGVLLDIVRNPEHALDFAECMHKMLREPLETAGRRIEPSVSIGVVLGRSDCSDVQDLLQDADTAMYRAKASQRGTAKLFDMEMRRRLMRQVQLESDLAQGVERGEFLVFFQPIVRLADLRTAGFEALSRWLHPQHGLITAAEFMPVANSSEMGRRLTWSAVEQTLRQATHWTGRFDPPVRLFLNVSERQFSHKDFVHRMETLLHRCGADPRGLVLEITEEITTDNSEAEQKLHGLKSLGFQLALDDFGVGRSSLNRLCKLPIDVIKIDSAFIQSIELSESQVLVRAIEGVGADLGMEVIAEGIETEHQRTRLLDLGVEVGQGYLFGKAVPAQEAELRLTALPVPQL